MSNKTQVTWKRPFDDTTGHGIVIHKGNGFVVVLCPNGLRIALRNRDVQEHHAAH